MPFQPINFSNIAPQGNPALRDFMNNLEEGYKIGQTPAIMARQKDKEELANAWQQLLNQEQPEKFKAEMTRNNLLNSLTNMQMQGMREDRDPNIKVARTKAFIDALKNSGIQVTPEMETGFYRKSMGLDEQSPMQKMQQALALEKAKNALKGSDDITTANRSKNLAISQAVDDTLPLLQQLQDFNAPGQFIGKYLSADDQASYEGLVGSITDSMLGAFGLPKTNESIALVDKMVGKRPRESDDHYKKRLTTLHEDLIRRKNRAVGSLGSKNSAGGQTFNLATGGWE